MAMKYRLTALALVCLALGYGRQAPPLSAVEAPVYEIDDLGSVGGNFTLPSDINDVGDVVGAVQTSTFDYHAFLYTDDSGLRDLGTFDGTGWSQAFGINNQRHLSGYFTRADGSIGAFLYGDDIGTIDLGGLPGTSVNTARGLNDSDQVTGSSFLLFGAHGFLWSVTRGMQDLGTLGGSVSNGARINVHGQVVGQSIVVDDPNFPIYHAFRYTDGIGMQDLGTLPGTSRTFSSARGINADGDVVGYSNDPAFGANRAFLYSDRDGMRDLGTLGGRSSLANDINDNGEVVGIADLPSAQGHPFLYSREKGMVDLNSLIDSTTGWTLWTAEAINNRGTIVGVATMGGRSRGYRARRRDNSPPEIEASLSPQPNAAGWNTSDVTVAWSVRDPESGVVSSSGCSTQTVTNETAGVTLTCSAVNGVGGVSSRSVTVKIDKTPPVLTCAATPSMVWPPNGNMVPVSIAVTVRDALSGTTAFTLHSFSVDDPTASPQTVTGFAVGTPSTNGFVEALRRGTGEARVYAFTYTSIDAAGVTGSCTAQVVVPHDVSQ
jgi:probable HAF family extracellular repeat protein